MERKTYIVYDGKIGIIEKFCKCDACKQRGRMEMFINTLDNCYLDCIKVNQIYDLRYIGGSLNDAIEEYNIIFLDKIEKLETENFYLHKLIDEITRLEVDNE